MRAFISSLQVRKLVHADMRDPTSRKNLFDLYRDIFGHSGKNEWGEYLVCTDCKKLYSIEAVHDITGYTHVSDLPVHPEESKCCGVAYDHYHTDTDLEKRLNLVIGDASSEAFVLEDTTTHAVVGLIVGGFMPGEKAWNSIIKHKLKLTDQREPSLPRTVLYVDEIGIIKPYRRGIVPVTLLLFAFFKRMRVLNSGVNDMIFWTSEDSKLFKLIQQLPHSILLRDSSSPALVVLSLPIRKTENRVRLLKLLYT